MRLHRGRRRPSVRSWLVVLGWICASWGVYGDALASPMSWDFRFGPSLVGVTDGLADSLAYPRMGLDGGLSVRWPAGRLFSIQGDLLLATRSRGFDDVATSVFGAETMLRRSLRILYAQMPLLARATFSQDGLLRPYAIAGPYVAWRLSARFQNGEYVGDEVVNPADVRAVDYGTMLGVGTEIVTERGRIALEARLGLGGVDVLEDGAGIEGAYQVWTFFLAFTP